MPAWGLVVCLVYCLCLTASGSSEKHKISEAEQALYDYAANNATLVRQENGKIRWIVCKGTKHRFPDRYTFDAWGQHWDFAKPMNKTYLNSLSDGPKLPSLRDHHSNEEMLSLVGNRQSPFITETKKVFPSNMNLNYVYWSQGGERFVVLCWRDPEHQKFRVVAMRAPQSQPQSTGIETQVAARRGRGLEEKEEEKEWSEEDDDGDGDKKNEGSAAEKKAEKSQPDRDGVASDSDSIYIPRVQEDLAALAALNKEELLGNGEMLFLDFLGEDPRLFVSKATEGGRPRLWVVYCKRFHNQVPEIRMAFSPLLVHTKTGTEAGGLLGVYPTKVVDIAPSAATGSDGARKDYKNWSPFEHSAGLHFIAHTSPLMVVRVRVGDVGDSTGGGDKGDKGDKGQGFSLSEAALDGWERVLHEVLDKSATIKPSADEGGGARRLGKELLDLLHADVDKLLIDTFQGAESVQVEVVSSEALPFPGGLGVKTDGMDVGEPTGGSTKPIFEWEHFRGGTPAVLVSVQPKTNAKASPKAKSTLVSTDSPSVPEQVQIQMYLSFFHSSNTPKDNNKNKQNEEGRIALTDVRKTYKMGAFLFSAQPPFAVRAISTLPLVAESMYSGPWADPPFSFYHMDYIVFPTNLLYVPDTEGEGEGGKGEREKGGELLLQYGRQDLETWVARMSLAGLVDSMKWE